MNIFDQPYYSLAHFSDEIYVSCHRCCGLGVVTAQKEHNLYKNAQFHCGSCGYVASSPAEWFGYYVGYIGGNAFPHGIPCGFCGSQFRKEVPITKTPYKEE